MVGKFEYRLHQQGIRQQKSNPKYLPHRHIGMVIGFVVFLLTACSGGAVQFAPTPLPADTSPRLYTHPSTAFSLAVPPNWSVYEQNVTNFATASFALPDTSIPALNIRLIRLSVAPDAQSILPLLERYQTQIRPDRLRYDEQDRQQLADDSWRITGALRDAIGVAQPVNTFIRYEDDLLLVVDILVSMDDMQQSQLEQALNTIRLNTDAQLIASELEVFAQTASTRLEIANVSLWTNPSGVFFITGEVANHGDQIVGAIPIRASLLNQDGNEVAGAIDATLGHGILPTGFAPFGLRFGQGQPYDATAFRIEIGGASAESFSQDNVISAPDLIWTDTVEVAGDGQLFFSGIVQNMSSSRVRDVRVLATVFGEDGQVIGVGYANSDVPVLEPFAEANYVILVPEAGGIATNYIVTAQGLRCTLEDC